eukprot:SAG11_NODE_232_length_11930_cov_6.884794_2_plen_147_part_00
MTAPGLVTSVVYSDQFDVRPGQIVLSENMRIPLVDAPAAIVHLVADLVDDTGSSVPLSQAYVHHWFLVGTSHKHPYPVTFGAGSEFRGLPGMRIAATPSPPACCPPPPHPYPYDAMSGALGSRDIEQAVCGHRGRHGILQRDNAPA